MAPAALRTFRMKATVGPERISAAQRSMTHADLLQATADARKGMAAVLSRYQEFVDFVDDITPEIMEEAMDLPFQLSQVYVPKDTGRLAASGYVMVTSRGKTPAVEIGYGRGNNPDYAALQHENVEFHHDAPQRSKYLEAALDEEFPAAWNYILNQLSRVAR